MSERTDHELPVPVVDIRRTAALQVNTTVRLSAVPDGGSPDALSAVGRFGWAASP